MKKYGFLTVFALTSIVMFLRCSYNNNEIAPALKSIDENKLKSRIATLASDEFLGRAPASLGEERTIKYLEDQFKENGLKPGNNKSYFQEIPLVEIVSDPSMKMIINSSTDKLNLTFAEDFVVGTSRVVENISVKNSDLIFAGYGIVAPEYNWNDYAGLDVKGKTVLVLVNDPGFATSDNSLFNGKSMTYYGRWTYKFEEAARQGARGIIIIHDTEPAGYPWSVVRTSWAGTGLIGSDIDYPNTINVSTKFKPLRYSLTEPEIKRDRWLGEQTTEAVTEICKRIKPGMNEFEIEVMTAAELRSRGILPTVLLIGVDDRIYKYRHALPGGAVLQKYAMVNVVAEKWGMPIAVTRFVYFWDKLPDELKNKLEKTAIVNAHFQEATVPGKSMEEIWEGCKKWYTNVGFENEWMKHHQGGAIGYDDREYVIWPGNKEVVQENQAFAWNPTITGAKVEETIIARKDGFEVVTKSKDWPMINVELNGKIYPQPGILLKNPPAGKIIEQKDYTIKP